MASTPTTDPFITSASEFSHLGWTLNVLEDHDSDGFACNGYEVVSGANSRILPWSRFEAYRESHFQKFIELGLPTMMARPLRGSPSAVHLVNWSPEDIEAAHAALHADATALAVAA